MLKDMGKAAEEVLEQAADAGGRLALLEAKRRCPVRTGRLKESLHLQNGKKTEIKADVKYSQGKRSIMEPSWNLELNGCLHALLCALL